MREIRPSGSEGGAGRKPRSYLYQIQAALSAAEVLLLKQLETTLVKQGNGEFVIL